MQTKQQHQRHHPLVSEINNLFGFSIQIVQRFKLKFFRFYDTLGVSNKENASHLSNANQTSATTSNSSSNPIENDKEKLESNKAVENSASSAVNIVASNANKEEDKLDERYVPNYAFERCCCIFVCYASNTI